MQSSGGSGGQQLTEREAAILTEYELIRNEVKKMGSLLADINSEELDTLGQSMRGVEQKVALVYTLFRSSIYAHLSQQEAINNINNNNPEDPSTTTVYEGPEGPSPAKLS